MDYISLAAAHLPAPRQPRKDASAEERYWRAQAGLPPPNLRLIGQLATTAGLILLLVGLVQA